ncbi:MAG TPA: maleylpyruvate isomerase family mycothiol-dependent enzyme [Nocardioides sp.]|nr:maleylpyruvate isomerase family mycothiol-dependent enzyme [Nocardioides sp.]
MTTNREDTQARRGRMERRTAMRLAAEEYTRFADAVAALGADDWTRPTECPAWDVRQLVCHVVGMAEMAAGVREGNRQRRIAGADAARERIAFIDALTAVQVRERADWGPEDAVRGARAVAPRAARGRRWTPFFVRRRTMPVPQEVNGRLESWSIGYLVDTILTRDPWMHRVDLSTATGHALELTAEHDGAIVADVVQEWAERHGEPHSLTLTGPAGGSWTRGHGGPTIEMDAIEFCRVVSGRGTAEGLLETQVPF